MLTRPGVYPRQVEDEEALAKDMEQLKYTDPEFYAFLKKDEPGLLNFKPSTQDDDDSGGEDDDDEEAGDAVSDEVWVMSDWSRIRVMPDRYVPLGIRTR